VLQGAIRFVEARRSSLPPPIGHAFKGVPGLAILLGATLALLGILIVLIVLIARAIVEEEPALQRAEAPTSSVSVDARAAPAAVPGTKAEPTVETALATAKEQGLAALEALAKEQPNDGTVLLALAQARVEAKKYAEAVAALSSALEVDPELNVSKKVASLLFTTAQSKSGREATFQLLEGPMGSRGADIAFDIWMQEGVKGVVKARAEHYLKSQGFERVSSPELNIAVALRLAERCEQKHGLLLRAKNVGDQRSLTYLTKLSETAGCGAGGKQDCYPCLRKDARLADAMAAIAKRTGQ
jgi:tetratricopeptide (TPR) repeat protein